MSDAVTAAPSQCHTGSACEDPVPNDGCRLPDSCRHSYERQCTLLGRQPDPDVNNGARSITVFPTADPWHQLSTMD